MTREQAKEFIAQSVKSDVDMALVADAIKTLEQEPKEITLDEVKEYCSKRCLTIVTNELFHELTHHQEPILDKIRAEIEVKLAEPQYQHEEEDWQAGLIMAETIIDKYKAESEE